MPSVQQCTSSMMRDECIRPLHAKHSGWCGLASIVQAIIEMFPNNCVIMFPATPVPPMVRGPPANHLGRYPLTTRTRTINLPQVQVLVSTVLSTRVLWHPLLVGVGAIIEGCSLPLLLYLMGGGLHHLQGSSASS